MTPRERLARRLAGEPVDRPPNLNILMAYAARRLGVSYAEYCRDHRRLVEAHLLCNEAFGIDLLSTMSDPLREASDLGARIEFPPEGNPLCVELPVKTAADLGRLRRVAPADGPRMADRLRAIEDYRRAAGDHWPILGWVEGPLAEAADLHGVSETMVDLQVDPEFVKDLMAFCREVVIDFARAQIAAGAEVVGMGDAVASLIGPEVYAELVLPEERAVVDAVHAAGARVKLHICGNTTHLLDLIGETGADIIDVDWMVDMGQAVQVIGPRAAVCGNFDPVTVALQGTPAAVRAAVHACVAAGDARTCIAAGCEIPRETPEANLRAVDEALREVGATAARG